MNIGIVKEKAKDETRVVLTPMGVASLVRDGHDLCVETGAGKGSGFPDEAYAEAGATVCYTFKETFGRSDLILKVSTPTAEEVELLREDQILGCFWHMIMAKKDILKSLLAKRVTCLGFEIMEDSAGRFPVRWAMSEIAGQLSASVSQFLLQESEGGRGVLLGGGPGIPSASVVILGGGVVGRSVARAAMGLGAQVMVLDSSTETLRSIHDTFAGRVITSMATVYNIKRALTFADVVIGAISLHGEKTPVLITEEMLALMRPKSILLDISIDQGGIAESSRPTTLSSPTYVTENIIHYCVPNMASNVPRTATHALTAAILPYIKKIASLGFDESFVSIPEVNSGTYIHRGNPMKPWIKEYFDLS